ncbi:MAG: hypothetical protein ABI220_04145 [Candidatus Saccharimonadales bacterium]
MDNIERDNVFKNLATLLSLLLPIAQVFTTLLPPTVKKIILFDDQLLLISIFAGVMAYLLIVAFKSTVWFQFTFQRSKKTAYDAQQLKFNLNVYDQKEINKIVKNNEVENQPYYINPQNIYYLLLPILVFCLLVFIFLGLFFPDTNQSIIVFTQAIIYIFLVSLTSLTLGVFYINDANRNRRDNRQRKSWERLKVLLFTRQAVPELPIIDFVAELQINPGNQPKQRTIIRVDNSNYYAVDTDLDCTKLFEISVYNPTIETTQPLNEVPLNE